MFAESLNKVPGQWVDTLTLAPAMFMQYKTLIKCLTVKENAPRAFSQNGVCHFLFGKSEKAADGTSFNESFSRGASLIQKMDVLHRVNEFMCTSPQSPAVQYPLFPVAGLAFLLYWPSGLGQQFSCLLSSRCAVLEIVLLQQGVIVLPSLCKMSGGLRM